MAMQPTAAGTVSDGVMAPSTSNRTEEDLAAEIADDGTVELALMATDHPEIHHFGKLVLEHARTASSLSCRCAAWLGAGSFPQEALDAYRSVQATVGSVSKEIECLDSIDLNELQPGWGDKATVRMSRKGLIGFAERVMTRLDDLLSHLSGPARTLKERRRVQASKRCPEGVEELSLEEKYREKFNQSVVQGPTEAVVDGAPRAGTILGQQPTPTGPGARQAQAPPSKRPRTISAADVEALLLRLQARTRQPLQRRSLQAFHRQLTNIAALPDLVQSPALCRDGVECALGSVQAALAEGPGPMALRTLMQALQQLEALKEPTGLRPLLLDLADVLQSL